MAIKKTGNDTLTDVTLLSGKVLGAQRGAADAEAAVRFEEKLIAEGHGGYKELFLYGEPAEGYLALENGTVDGMMSSTMSVAKLNKFRPGAFEPIGVMSDLIRYSSWATPADGTRPVVQRLGYLLDWLGHGAKAEAMHHVLLARGQSNWTELDRAEARDPDFAFDLIDRNPRWRVIIRRNPEVDE